MQFPTFWIGQRHQVVSYVGILALAAATFCPSALPSQPPARRDSEASATPPVTRHPSPVTSFRVRPANQELLDQAQALLNKIRTGTEKLAARAGKTDELRGKSDSLRKEIVELYRAIHQVGQLGDELLLRGERDGELLRSRAEALRSPLDAAVADVRPALGNPQGIVNAMTRRAKEQLVPVKQLDELIKQKKWAAAYAKLEGLIEAADEVGRFADPKEAEAIFRPLTERTAQVRPGYLAEKRPTVVPALREEYAGLRPDLDSLRQQLVAVAKGVSEKNEVRWNDQLLSGPDFLRQLADSWPKTDQAVAQAAAVLHSIGNSAESELKSLRADYGAARIQAITLVRELILAETQSISPSDVESRYVAYLDAIPRLMTALHGTPDDFRPASTPLNQLAARSPELAAKVQRYREATDEALRWRRRMAKRYQQNLRQKLSPGEPIAKLLDHPPALPGQEGPAGLKRTNQMFWSFEQAPDSVASVWTEHWKDTATTVQQPAVRWPPGADPQFVSPWHRHAAIEASFSRQTLYELTQGLAKDLLTGEKRPALTLEVALAIQTATFGPYSELGGTLTGATLDNLPDRLWDLHEPLDISGSLVSESLQSPPALPALVRLQLKPSWFAHELFVWSSEPPPSSSPTPPPPAKSPPVASQPQPPPPPADKPAPETPAPPAKPSLSPAAPAGSAGTTQGSTQRPPSKKSEPAKPAPPPPKGGVRF